MRRKRSGRASEEARQYCCLSGIRHPFAFQLLHEFSSLLLSVFRREFRQLRLKLLENDFVDVVFNLLFGVTVFELVRSPPKAWRQFVSHVDQDLFVAEIMPVAEW